MQPLQFDWANQHTPLAILHDTYIITYYHSVVLLLTVSWAEWDVTLPSSLLIVQGIGIIIRGPHIWDY